MKAPVIGGPKRALGTLSYRRSHFFHFHAVFDKNRLAQPPLVVIVERFTFDIDMRDNGSVSGEVTVAAAAIWESGSVA